MKSTGFLRDLRRAVSWHRRLLAAGLAAAAVALALTVVRPAPPPTAHVLAATHDLAAGTTLDASDVRTVDLPPHAVPDGAYTGTGAVVGQVLSGPVRRAEPITDVRIVGASGLSGYGNGKVGTPVRIADPGMVSLVHPGSVVDVIATPTAAGIDVTGPAKVIAKRVRVVSVPRRSDSPRGSGTLIVVAATPKQAAALAKGSAGARLSIALHSG